MILPWLDAARAEWLPRESVPLVVRAWLWSPVAVDAFDGLRLEGALGWAVVALASGLPPPDAFAGVARSQHVDLPVPITDVEMCRRAIACASDAQVPSEASEVLRKRRRKPHPEALGLARVMTTGGPYKALDIGTPATATPCVWWHVRGDRTRLTRLLREVHAVGRGRSGGLGQVIAWEVLDDPDDASLTRDGRPMRALPVADALDADARFPGGCAVREASVRAPHWHRATRTLCAVPC